jgi:hypothetical protein
MGELLGVNIAVTYVAWLRAWQRDADWLRFRVEGGYPRRSTERSETDRRDAFRLRLKRFSVRAGRSPRARGLPSGSHQVITIYR